MLANDRGVTAPNYTAFTPQPYNTDPCVRRPTPPCTESLLSPATPNAHWPVASLVLAPILNLRGRSR